jgi:hypothetical protein
MVWHCRTIFFYHEGLISTGVCSRVLAIAAIKRKISDRLISCKRLLKESFMVQV